MADPCVHDALVLAGGQSRRMRTPALPDIDKGLMHRRGRPLVAGVCAYLRAQGIEHIRISSNRYVQDYEFYGPVVTDSPDFLDCGPLAGVLAGLQGMRGEWLFVLPVDVVCWPADLLPRLSAVAAVEHPAYACTPDGPHPLCLLLHRDQQAGLREFLLSGRRQVMAWLRGCGGVTVDFPDERVLINLNTPEDWGSSGELNDWQR